MNIFWFICTGSKTSYKMVFAAKYLFSALFVESMMFQELN